MAGEWRTTTIDELKAQRAGSIAIGPFGSRMKSDCYVSAGVPVIRGTNISDTRGFTGEMVYVSPGFADGLGNAIVRADDLVFPHRGAIGQVGIVPHDENECYVLSSSMMKLTCDRQKAEPLFLFYFFRSAVGQHELLKNASTVGTPGIGQPLSSLKSIQVTLPTLAEQKVISSVLGALDDKIDLNRRMNAALEALARALFHNWFVDFGPSSGNAPADWRWSTVGRELKPVLGGTPSRAKAEYWTGGDVPWINSGKTNEFRIIEPSEWITAEALANSATKMVPARTTVLAITGATLGQVSVVEIECCANQSVVAIPASDALPTEFIYPWIKENIQKLIASQTGGAQQHINKGNVEELAILVPRREAMDAYLRNVRPLFDKIAANCFESRTLANLRDSLLPKLLSGEICVLDAVNQVEAVA